MSDRSAELKAVVDHLLDEAKRQGADAAEAGVTADGGLSVTVRLGEIETVERTNDHQLGITVYLGQRKGSASTTDLSPEAVKESVAAACRIARNASEDPFAGLADPARMATDVPDLDLHHPWDIDVEHAAELAQQSEAAARNADDRITNSEGATLSSQAGAFIYGNTNGFIGGYPTTRHSISCSVIAEDKGGMQRDYWYSTSRAHEDLDNATDVGRKAAERALGRLGAQKIGTRSAPVIFRAEVASGLLRSLVGAIRGHAIYRKSSFLLDQVGSPVFPDWVNISENPHKPRGLASAPFDSEGVATEPKALVSNGVLQTYVLDSYSARKLELETTGNAGGVRNLAIEAGPDQLDLDALIKQMDTGLIVTELMGHGTNLVTGDYSRGASGLWVENGEIQFPVEEITVAGNLKGMFAGLQAVGTDNDVPGSVDSGSWLIDEMTIAGD